MVNKKGDYKYGIILSLILGVMVLSLSLYFIFQELWSSDELDWEICRQSIQIRALLPEATMAGITVTSFKDSYPLKCKTQIVTIDKGDVKKVEDAQRIIAETMAKCWALYDKGDSNAFPAKFFKSSTCVPCARIHLTEDAKKYMREHAEIYKDEEEGVFGINIKNSLNAMMTKEYSYYKYLNNSGKKFAAFNFGNAFPFNLEGESFKNSFSVVKNIVGFWENAYLVNRLSGGDFTAKMPPDIEVSLPKIFDITKGDLLINYGIVTVSDKDFGNYMPYLFYFQQGQTNPSPFEEVEKDFIINFWSTPADALELLYTLPKEGWSAFKKTAVGFCEQWEGIPA